MILTIKSALGPLSFSISDHDQIYVQSEVNSTYRNGETFLDWMSDILHQFSISYCDIQTAIFIDGPGSYTGLRVGATILNMLRLTYPITIQAVSSSVAYAAIVPDSVGFFGMVLPGCRGCVFVRFFSNAKGVLEAVSDGRMIGVDVFQRLKMDSFRQVPLFGVSDNRLAKMMDQVTIDYTKISFDYARFLRRFRQDQIGLFHIKDWIYPRYQRAAVYTNTKGEMK